MGHGEAQQGLEIKGRSRAPFGGLVRAPALRDHISFRLRAGKAHGPFGEVFRIRTEGMIETGPVVLPGDDGREFDQLRVAEAVSQFVEESVRHFDRRVRHGIGVLEHQYFFLRKDGAGAVIGKGFNLLGGNAFVSADRRPNINSKRTADQRGDAQLGKVLEVRGGHATAGERLFHLSVAPENFGMMSRDLHRSHDFAELAPGHGIDKAGEETAEPSLVAGFRTGNARHESS